MSSSPGLPFRSIVLPAIVPTLLFAIGEGAILPIIPLLANDLGATLALAGLVAAMITLGTLVGDIPSGWVVARVGERRAMTGAALLCLVGLGIGVVAPAPAVLGVGVFLIGLSTAVFALARHAYMTTTVPREYRARALSLLGGTFRLGFFLGPFISAAVIHLTGDTRSALWVHVVACLATAAVLLLVPDPTVRVPHPTAGEEFVQEEARGLFRTIRDRRAVLARLGLGAALVGASRASRQVILPLWAVSIGMADAQAALIIGIAGAVDFALFYAGGQIMDRFGRLWTAVPSLLGLATGHAVLAVTHDLAAASAWFVVAAIVMALANGIGSGILMTIGADLADQRNPAPFLGAWRFTGDVGAASAPLFIAAVTGVASLAAAAGAVGVLSLIGAGVMLRYIPRYAPHRR